MEWGESIYQSKCLEIDIFEYKNFDHQKSLKKVI